MKPFITAALFYLLAGTDAARPQENQATLEHGVVCTDWDETVSTGNLCNILKVVEHANNSPAIECLKQRDFNMTKVMQRFTDKTFSLFSQTRLDLLKQYRFVSSKFSDDVMRTFQSKCEEHFIETVHKDWIIITNIEKYPELKASPAINAKIEAFKAQIKDVNEGLVHLFCSETDVFLKIEEKEGVTHITKADKRSPEADSDRLSHPDSTEDDTTQECTQVCTEECIDLKEPQNSSAQPFQRYKISPDIKYISGIASMQYYLLTLGKTPVEKNLYGEGFNKVKEYFIKQIPQWYEHREKMFIDMVRTELKYC